MINIEILSILTYISNIKIALMRKTLNSSNVSSIIDLPKILDYKVCQ